MSSWIACGMGHRDMILTCLAFLHSLTTSRKDSTNRLYSPKSPSTSVPCGDDGSSAVVTWPYPWRNHLKMTKCYNITLQWCHNGRDGVSNHRHLDCSPTVCSGADQRKHQSCASLTFVRGINRSPVNSPHKGPVTRKIFLFHDVIMICQIESSMKGMIFHRDGLIMFFAFWTNAVCRLYSTITFRWVSARKT